MRRATPAIFFVLAAAGCWVVPTDGAVGENGGDNGGGNGNGGDNGGVVSGELTEFRYATSDVVPNVLRVSWSTNLPGTSYVKYGLNGSMDKRTPTTTTSATEHSLLVLGLKSRGEYAFQAVTVTDDGQTLEGEPQTIEIAIQPQELPVLDLAVDDGPSAIEGGDSGFVLVTMMMADDSWLGIVDRDGDYVWYLRADDGLNIPSAHPAPDGSGFIYTQNDRYQKSDYGGIVHVDMEGNKVITYAPAGHHDANQIPGEDTIAYIAVDTDVWDVGGRGDLTIAYDQIWENRLGASDDLDLTQIWSLSERESDYEYEPWNTCRHFSVEAYNTGGNDWTHSNSIMPSADGEYLFLMSKNLDALWKIDRATGTEVWQMGGRDSDFTLDGQAFVDSPNQWSHGHMSDIWDGGFCMFDNGYHHNETAVGESVPHSRIVEYSFDESARSVSKVWEYWLPNDGFNAELGDCRHLENGNYLMSVTNNGYFSEINHAGQEVWRINVNESGTGTGRVTYLEDLYSLAHQ